MSSSESDTFSYRFEKFNDPELEEFISSGYQGAENLRKVGRRIIVGRRPSGEEYFSNYASGMIYEDDGKVAGQMGTLSQTKSPDELLAAFNEWKDKNKATKEKHKAYVDALKERPGRDATILVPSSGPENKTILGATASKRTVLG